jgi:hypothetical protein
MKSRILGAVALAFAFTQIAAPAAYAEQAAAQFRSAAPQAFTADDLQRYGLSAEASDRAVALQEQGYEVRVLSHEEAQQYQAGITDNQWLLIGILAAVVVIAVAVSD